MKVRVLEQQDVLPRTGNLLMGLFLLVRDRLLIWDHQVAWENQAILGSKCKKLILELKE